MSETTTRLALPLLAANQSQKHVTHNEALLRLDDLVHLAVREATRATPPMSPAAGDRYLIPGAATGIWSGRTGQVALWQEGGWSYLAPSSGWRLWVEAERRMLVHDGTGWQDMKLRAADQLGVNASADPANRLSVSSPAVLFSHAGAGHQVKVNKAAASETASVVFQNGFSGRAEIGLAGDDAWQVKVSADGASWTRAVTVDGATGWMGIGVAAPSCRLHVSGPVRIGQYPKAALPSAAASGAGALVHVSDEAGGPVIAFSDGAAWRRVTDRAVVA